MDWITRRYRSQMRLFPDRLDVAVWGRWHWCPDNAVCVPYYHPFTSLENVDRELAACETELVLGEVYGSNDINLSFSDPPGLTGTHWCGDEKAWTQGVSYAQRGLPTWPDGVPLCCPRADVWFAGSAEGGAFLDQLGPDTTMGGEAEGGAFLDQLTPRDTYMGGEAEGGLWLELPPYLDLWAGGEAEGGRWNDHLVAPDLWAGGEAEGGRWNDHLVAPDLWAGGEAEGGRWNDHLVAPDVWNGGEAEGGLWTAWVHTPDLWSGGQAEGGRWLEVGANLDVWGGGQAEGGAFLPYLDVWGGGQAEGGKFNDVQPGADVWRGGQAEGGEFSGEVANVWGQILGASFIPTDESTDVVYPSIHLLTTIDTASFSLSAGDNVLVEWRCQQYNSNAGTYAYAELYIDFNGASVQTLGPIGAANEIRPGVYQWRITGLAAGDHSATIYVATSGGTQHFSNRELKVILSP